MLYSKYFSLIILFLIFAFSCGEKSSSDNVSPKPPAAAESSELDLMADTTLAGDYFEKGVKLGTGGKYDSAAVYLEKAQQIYEKVEHWEMLVRCLHKLGSASLNSGDYTASKQYLDKALALAKDKLGESHRLIAENHYEMGVYFFAHADYDSAIHILNESISKRKTIFGENDPIMGPTYDYLGHVYRQKGEYDKALEYHQKALSIYQINDKEDDPGIATVYNGISGAHWGKGEYDKGLEFALKALSIWQQAFGIEHQKTSHGYNNVAIFYANKGDYDNALEYFQKGLSIRLAAVGEQHPYVATSYHNIAKVYQMKGDNTRAIEFSEKGLQVRRNLVGEMNPELAWEYNGLGTHYGAIGKYQKGLELSKKALSIWKQTLGEENTYTGYAYKNVGKFNSYLGNYKKAIESLNKSLGIFQVKMGKENPETVSVFWDIAEVYQQMRDYQQSLKLKEKALAINITVLGEKHPQVAIGYNSLASTFYKMGEYWKAAGTYQKAICANLPSFSNPDPYETPPVDRILSESDLLTSLIGKSKALAAYYENASQNIKDLKAAAATDSMSLQIIDRLRSSFRTAESKLHLATEVAEIYENAIQNAYQLQLLTGERKYRETAFMFSEKSKANLLLEALSEAKARQFAGIPDSLLEKEKQLRIDFSFYDKSLTEELLKAERADSAKLSLYKDKVFKLNQASDDLFSLLEQNYPDYFALKYQVNVASIENVQKEILQDQQSTFVEYFVGKNSIYVFAISHNQFDLTKIEKDYLLESQIDQLRDGIINQNYAQYATYAAQLYQRIWQPISDKIQTETVLIVPDGRLNFIPFEALLTSAVDTSPDVVDYRPLPYLAKKHHIGYSYSASLLLETLNRQRRKAQREYLAYAPVFPAGIPANTRGSEFVRENQALDSTRNFNAAYLPASEDEVLGIQNVFNEKAGFFQRLFGNSSNIYLKDEANEVNLKTQGIDDYQFVHFATHGLINETNPQLSGLVLAQDSTLKEDGILYLGEIYNLNLNADLVVLSACETGLGKIARGEGLIGLTRGFLFAGAQNLLVSLWQVNDASTAQLMIDFYRFMLDGKSKFAALRQAKLALIENDPKYADPFYWAPFVLIWK